MNKILILLAGIITVSFVQASSAQSSGPSGKRNSLVMMAVEDGNTCRAANVAFLSLTVVKAKYGSAVSESVLASAIEFLDASCTSEKTRDGMMKAVASNPESFGTERTLDVAIDFIALIKEARIQGLRNVKDLFRGI